MSRACTSCDTPLPADVAFCPACGAATPTGDLPEPGIDEDRLRRALRPRYVIERQLGRGGMAQVYLASDPQHARPVAVKVMLPHLAAMLGTRRFLREIQIAARLSHPHILPVHDSGESDGFLYYVMPFVDGESLRDRLRRERQLPIDEAVRITSEVAEALQYAHRADVIHRDVKPENILLSQDHALVADFGIAKALSTAGGAALTSTGASIGTPLYMSPEQAAADPAIDGRTDVYSLSCVLYEMLAGEPPFTGPSVHAILAKHALEPRPSVRTVRDTVPEATDSAIRRGMAKAAVDRPRSAAAFAAAVRASVERWGVTPPHARGFRRSRLAAGLGLATLAVAALAVGVGLWRTTAEPGIPAETMESASPTSDTAAPDASAVGTRDGLSEPTLATLSLTPAVHALEPRDTVRLTPNATGLDGTSVPLARMEWRSSVPAVASVSPSGLVRARAPGRSHVVGRAGGRSASVTVLVQPSARVPVAAMVIRGAPDTTAAGAVTRLRAVPQDADGAALDLTPAWWSSDTLVAVVDTTGMLHARQPGVVTVGAAAGRVLSTVRIVVIPRAEPVLAVTILPRRPLPLRVGEQVQLVARPLGSDSQPVAAVVRWTSGDDRIARISETGLVTGLGPGTTSITAASGAVSGAVPLTVQPSLVQPRTGATKDAITILLRQYALALESRDPGLLRQVYPTITDVQQAQLFQAFAAMGNLTVSVDSIGEVDVRLDTASVPVRITWEWDGEPAQGRMRQSQHAVVVAVRRDGPWRITQVR